VARDLLRTAWSQAFVVGVEVFGTAKGAFGVFSVGYADIGRVAELKAVFADRVTVGGVNSLSFASFVEDCPVDFLGRVDTCHGHSRFLWEGGSDGREGSLGFGSFSVFPVSEEADFERWAHGVGFDLGGETCKEGFLGLFQR